MCGALTQHVWGLYTFLKEGVQTLFLISFLYKNNDDII